MNLKKIFTSLKQSLSNASKHFLKDKEDMTDLIDVYNKTIDYIEACSERMDELNVRLIRIGWQIEEIQNQLKEKTEE